MCVCMCVYVKETKRMTRKSECKKEREKVCVFLGCVSFLRRTKSRRKGKRNLQERMRELKKNKKKKIKKNTFRRRSRSTSAENSVRTFVSPRL